MNEILSLVLAPYAHLGILIGSTVLMFLLGNVWYAPSLPIGRVWLRYQKIEKNHKPNMALIMWAQLLMTFIFVHTTLTIWLALGGLGLSEGVRTLFLLKMYAGFVITKEISSWLFERKPFPLMLVGVGYYLVGILILVGMCSYLL